MPIHPLRLCRSILFLPASNPRAIEKARTLPADMIILDLEDGVKGEDKDDARSRAMAAADEGFGGRPVAIRVNAPGTTDYGRDVVQIRDCGADYIVLPKVEQDRQVRDTRVLATKPVIAMIETPHGVLHAPAIAAQSEALIAGTNDLSAQLGLPAGQARSGLAHALQSIVLAGRAAGIAVFDGVYNRLDDSEGLEREALDGRASGFDGKTLIHPSQIDGANRVFSPGKDEIDEARRLIAAATGGAERFEGRMIESMHVRQAEWVLAKARL